ncbi:MAG: HIT domain-containing protein [Candidatus Saccharimonadales bacterium]
MQEPSIFTRIINGEIPSHKVYEDDRILAILDVRPVFEGHTLVITKKQVDHIWDLDDDEYDYLWKTTKKIGQHIREVIKSPRVGIVVEGYGVPHVHVHIIPIYEGDDLKKSPDFSKDIDHGALARTAARLLM